MTTWAHKVKVEVRIPDPTARAFRLSLDALGGDVPLATAQRAFILGQSRLTADAFGDAAGNVWWDITEHATLIRTHRGQRDDRPDLPPDVGWVEVTFKGGPRLDMLGVFPGTALRVVYTGGNLPIPLWVGAVDDVDEDDDLESRHRWVTLTGHDAIRDLANRTRHGSRDGGTAYERFVKVATESTPYAVVWQSGTDGAAEDTVHETNVPDFLTMLGTGRFRWTLQHFIGLINFDELTLEDPTFIAVSALSPTLVMTEFSDVAQSRRSYYRITTRSGTSQLVTALELTKHGIGPDGNAADTTRTVADDTAAATYGTRKASLDTMAPLSQLDQIAAPLLASRVTTTTTVTSITVPGSSVIIDRLTELNPLDAIDITNRGTTHQVQIATIAHTISATRWRATLTTARR